MKSSLFSTALKTAGVLASGAVSSYMKRRSKTSKPSSRSNPPPRPRPKPKKKLRLRRRAPTRTVTRKRQRETQANRSDFSAIYKSGGKRLKLSKLVKANKEYGIYQYANISPFGGASGNFVLRNWQTALGAVLHAPVHLYDLSACNQMTGAGVVKANPVHMLRFTNETDTATVSWENLGVNYTTISSPNSTINPTLTDWFPGGRDVMEYVSADILFYCPSQTATRISVSLVQIRDEEFVPTNSATVRNTAFWQGVCKRFMRNPIETSDSRWHKYIKVLKTIKFYMDPKETTENVNARCKRVRLFQRLNRTCNYNYIHQDRINMLNQDEQINTGSGLQTTVHPNARIFLMITGQARLASADDAARHPTYDINLKIKHSSLSSYA